MQGHRFLLGIFAGLVLAAAVIAASSVGGAETGLPSLQPWGSSAAPHVASSNTAEVSSSTTAAVTTATMSSTTSEPSAPSTSALSNRVNSTTSRTTSGGSYGNPQSSVPSGQPSMAAGLLRSSVLALPVLAALLFGLLVYRVAAKDRVD